MSSNRFDICIIGGGIIGLSCAYYLSLEGKSVAIIDKGPKERASSHANCGLISPSHIFPLNNPTLIIKSLKWLFEKDAPFFIKPQLDLNLAKWLFSFIKNAQKPNVLRSLEARHQILSSSRELYPQLLNQENIMCNWSPDGYLFLFKTEKAFEDFRKENDFTKQYGYDAKPYLGKELQKLEPTVKDNVFGGWLQSLDAWLKPDELVAGLKNKLKEKGCTFFEEKEIMAFNGNGKLETISTSTGEHFKADNFILTTGAWTPLLKKMTRLNIPIVPAKGYSITMKKPKLVPQFPCNMMERKVVVTPFSDSYRIGSTLEFAGYDTTINRHRLDALKKGAAEYLTHPYSDEIYEEWFGWRPMTPDGVPIIDRSPIHSNLWLACGHNMLGVSMATGTGKLVSEMVLGKETHIDASLYSFSRF